MDARYADDYARLEKVHWWFRARRRILRRLIADLPWPPSPSILEIGAGTGENLYAVFPRGARLAGVEPEEKSVARARLRGPIPVHLAPAEALPAAVGDGSLDGIAMFDVLEHLADDRAALAALRAKLKPGGWLVITVPAFPLLWGRQDEINHHRRRYTRRGLRALLAASGFAVRRATFFNTLLFPPIAAARLLSRALPPRAGATGSDFDYPTGPLDPLLYRILASEERLLARVDLPFGVSLYAAAERRE